MLQERSAMAREEGRESGKEKKEGEVGRRWGVVGSSHSGILASKNILEYDPSATVTCFAPSPIRFAEVF